MIYHDISIEPGVSAEVPSENWYTSAPKSLSRTKTHQLSELAWGTHPQKSHQAAFSLGICFYVPVALAMHLYVGPGPICERSEVHCFPRLLKKGAASGWSERCREGKSRPQNPRGDLK